MLKRKVSVISAAFVLSLLITSTATAAVFDAYHQKEQKLKAKSWSEQQKQVDKKLAELEKKFGKKPNIIYILADDIGWGELGWQGGGKFRGTPSPALDAIAEQGIAFWSAYAEPSCTPTRIAINTGRHPVRTGLTDVLWPGEKTGLSPDEITIAEVLSDSGYDTAMWGKWHLGEEAKFGPENQGFDYAYYGLYNGAPDSWVDYYEKPLPTKAPFYDFPGLKEYQEMTGIDLSVAGYYADKGKKRQPIKGKAGKLGPERQEAFEQESIKQITQYIKDKADGDKPFYIYWATFAQQVHGSIAHQNDEGVDKANAQASMMAMHNAHIAQLMKTLKEQGIEENTFVVWISDNGPMYAFYPTSGYSLLKGQKGEVYEGGIRVPAMAVWPGIIEPGQKSGDLLHVTDLYTTAARIAGAMDKLPNDRVIDGIDQSSLFMLGEGNGHRNMMYHYSGERLAAIRTGNFKFHFKGKSKGGIPNMEFYNIMRDPGEKFGSIYPSLWAVAPTKKAVGMHKMMMMKYPNRAPMRPGRPQEK